MIFRQKKGKVLTAILILLAVTGACLYARAGGAGGSFSSGSSSNSGDGGFIIYLLYLILTRVPFPFNLLLVAVIIVIAIIFRNKQHFNQNSRLKNFSGTGEDDAKALKQIEHLPDFDLAVFKDKVTKAFTDIQTAWAEKKIGSARRYISDGVYQRFLAQTENMTLLGQKNAILNQKIGKITLDRVERDGSFDVIHVGIEASSNDRFISSKYPELNSGGYEEYVEFWTFLRRREAKGGDLYRSRNCPNCAAPIEKEITDVCRCPYCDTLLNSGNFDWVLTEITQADDYAASKNELRSANRFSGKLQKILSEDPDFSVQKMEDRVSNACLQIRMAESRREPERIRRFVNDAVYALVEERSRENDYIYNRLFLNDVRLIGVSDNLGYHSLYFSVCSSFQRVVLQDASRVDIIDAYVISEKEVVVMQRKIGAGEGKGSLYGNSCPGCGAPISDSTRIDCQYCGQVWNNGSADWAVSDLMTPSDYDAKVARGDLNLNFGTTVARDEKRSDLKDYLLTDLMILAAADGTFQQEERVFIEKKARQFGFSPQAIEPMFQLAAAGKLEIIMPESTEKRRRIYRILEEAALADGNIAEAERGLLNQIKRQYLA